MAKTFIRLLAVLCTLALPVSSFSAEAVKVRYTSSVYVDSKGDGLRLPEGVGCSEKPFFVVADTGNGRLLKYVFANSQVTGGEEIKVPEVKYPLRVQVDSKGDILVLDGRERRIVRLDSNGAFKGYLQPTGIASPASYVPRSFAIDREDNLYVLDIFSGRVLVLDSAGKYVRHLDFPQGAGFFSDLAVDQGGAISLLESVDAVVYKAARDAKGFSPVTEKLGEYMNFPTSLVMDKRGIMYIADTNGSGVVVIGQDGTFRGRPIAFGWIDGLVRYPSQLCITEAGNLFVADRENGRVEIFIVPN